MKLTLKQIQNILIGFGRITEEVKAGHLRLELGTTMAVAIAKKKLSPIYEAYTETRDDLLDQLCLKDEKGEKKKIPAQKDNAGNIVVAEQWDLGDNNVAWAKGVKELLTKEYDIDRLEPLKMEAFKIKKVKGADGKEEEGDIDPDILFLLVPWLILEG